MAMRILIAMIPGQILGRIHKSNPKRSLSLANKVAVAQTCMENAIPEVMESQMITVEEVSQNINVENDTQGSEQAVAELKEVTDDGFKQKKLKTSHKTLNIDNEVLAKVASDCGIVSREDTEEVDANIDLIKAKEMAEATLFEADKRREETQSVEEVLIEETKIEHNETHARILQKLEVSNYNKKQEFLSELEVSINESEVPLLARGDFNLVRRVEEKSSGNVNTFWMDAFNEFVANTELRELHRSGGQYTWTNKHINPIMVMMDRVFMSATWESHFPLVYAHSATRIGSDHNPLVVETCPERSVRSKIFRFEAAWTKQEGFMEWVFSKWPDRLGKSSIDAWQVISRRLRKYLRGWNGNWGGDMKERKQDLLLLIQDSDKEAERRSFEDREWERRYSLEEELVDIYNKEEVMWQTRDGERWLLEGDANTTYFHGIANGRKRKCMIRSLEEDEEVLTETESLKIHITNYYKKLFGSEPQSNIRLDPNLWSEDFRITMEENEELTKPFTLKELEEVVKSIRDSSAPGPDGFPAVFFKVFWDQVKDILLEMLQDLRSGWLDLFRLDYGILTFIPTNCAVERLFLKLQRLSRGLQKWGQRKVGNIKLQIEMAKEIIHRLEIARDSRELSASEEWLRKKLKLHCLGLASLERTIAHLCSRILYFREGDANTSFFHQQARFRKKKNFIAKLQVEDRLVTSQEDKQEAVLNFYDKLLGTAEEQNFSINLDEIGVQPMDLSSLEDPFIEEDVWATISDLSLDKASGPDGFTVKEFPCTYLGLPLSINKPTKEVLLPLIDKVADHLPSWKASLMNRAGQLVPHNAEALFKMVVDHIVGSGASTLFWKDRWIDGQTIEEVAPNLFKAIPKRITRRRTVAQALVNRCWVADIKGALSVQVLLEYLQIWDHVEGVVLQQEVPEQIRWKLSQNGSVSDEINIWGMAAAFKLQELLVRLNRVADKVISHTQSAFVPGRYILDGVVVIHEVLHELPSTKQSGIILKLDFEKAYDKMSWRFLEEAMQKKGFNEQCIEWVLKAVRGGRIAVNLNGELGNYFRSYKGLKQGDHYTLSFLIW
ncbi:uncharacterized protein [Miscanthus floridulus]|uniref:uncharacterized protein n=1 Tax=Miscanthus floridulus TaxID=154761 RepID=UPI003457CC5B